MAAAAGLFIVVIGLVTSLPSPLPGADPDPGDYLGTIYPQSAATFTAIGALALVAYLLSLTLFGVVARELKDAVPPLAQAGVLLCTLYVGLMVTAPGELVSHLFVTPQLSDPFRTGNPLEGVNALLTFQAFNWLSDQLFFTSLVFLFVGVILFGIAMTRAEDYGRRVAALVLVLGALGLATLPFIVLEPGSGSPSSPCSFGSFLA